MRTPTVRVMEWSDWIAASSALVGALIGAGAALLAQSIQLRGATKAAADQERKLAVEELLVRAHAVDQRSHQVMLLATNLGSFNGLVSRMIGNLAPVDLQAVFERLDVEGDALQRAASQIWLFADDEKMVALANSVVLAAMEVVEAHHLPRGGRTSTYAQVAILGRFANSDAEMRSARKQLSTARSDLVAHVRDSLGLAEIDLFASVTT